MNDEPANLTVTTPGLPVVVEREAFQSELDSLRIREKAHTREGDAIRPPDAGFPWWRWTETSC